MTNPHFLKINFDGSFLNKGDFGGASHVIKSASGALVAVGGVKLFETQNQWLLHGARQGLKHVIKYLKVTHIILMGNSLTVAR